MKNLFDMFAGMDYVDPVKKSGVKRKIVFAACLVTLCITMIKLSPSFGSPSPVSKIDSCVWFSVFILLSWSVLYLTHVVLYKCVFLSGENKNKNSDVVKLNNGLICVYNELIIIILSVWINWLFFACTIDTLTWPVWEYVSLV